MHVMLLMLIRFSYQNTIFPHIAIVKTYSPLILKLVYLLFCYRSSLSQPVSYI